MSFKLERELLAVGVGAKFLEKGSECDCKDQDLNSSDAEIKRFVNTIFSVKNLIFSHLYSDVQGKISIVEHEWKQLDDCDVVKAPLCLHSISHDCVRKKQKISQDDIDLIKEVFVKVSKTLKQMVHTVYNEQQPDKETIEYLDEVENDLDKLGISRNVSGKYSNIVKVAGEFEICSNHIDLLVQLSQSFVNKNVRAISSRIKQLQSTVSLPVGQAQFPKPTQVQLPEPAQKDKIEDVVDRVDPKDLRRKRARPRRTGEFPGQAIILKHQYVLHSNAKVGQKVDEPLKPIDVSQKNTNESESWCSLL